MMTRPSHRAVALWVVLAVCAGVYATALAGCGGFPGAQAATPTAPPSATTATPATPTMTHVYYEYPTGIPLPSGASAPNGGKVAAFDLGTGAVAWRYTIPPTRNPSVFQLIEAHGVVYVSSYADDPQSTTLDALDAANGKLLWSHTTPGMLADQVVVTGGAIFISAQQQDSIGGYTGVLQKLDARSGGLAWQFPVTGSPSPATVAGDTVYLTAMGRYQQDSQLFALNAATGATRWRYTTSAQLGGEDPRNIEQGLAPIVSGSLVSVVSTIRDYRGFAIQSALTLDSATGKPRWSYSTGGIAGAPLVAGATLYISASVSSGNSSDSSVMALRMSDGKLLWRRPAPAGHGLVSGMAFVAGAGGSGARLLVTETHDPIPTPGAELVALAPADGRTLWTTAVGQNAAGSPLLVDGLALVRVVKEATPPTSGPGEIQMVAVQPTDGHIRWRQVIGDWPDFGGNVLGIAGGSVFTLVTTYSDNAPHVYLLALRGSDGARQWQITPR